LTLMKTKILVLTILFSLIASTLYSQTVTNREKHFPEEFKTKWYYQFIEKLNLVPQDFIEFGYFFINGTLVLENESEKVYTGGVAIRNSPNNVNSKSGEFEVYYFSVFKAKSDYELFFENVEFWEVDQNGIMEISKTVTAKEGYCYKQHYRSDTDVLFTGELFITSEYEEMLKTYNID